MLAAVVSTKQGPFAQSKGLDVSCASQGYTIWWLMKNFILKATYRGVAIPGLDTERANHGPSQREAMEMSAEMRLKELTAALTAQKLREPDLGSFYFQIAPQSGVQLADDEEGGDVGDSDAAAPSGDVTDAGLYDGL